MDRYDELPDSICSRCETNLLLLVNFKNISIKNDKSTRLRLSHSNIKVEEIILDDLIWDTENCDVDDDCNNIHSSINGLLSCNGREGIAERNSSLVTLAY